MNVQFHGKPMRLVLEASLALAAVAITAVWQPAAKETDASVGRPSEVSVGSFRSRPHVTEDYRIYLVNSEEQADRLRFALSDMGAGEGTQPIDWGYEVVLLESAEDERRFDRNISDLNDSRIALGHNEIWVVDWRSV